MSKLSIDKTLSNGIKLKLLPYDEHTTRQTAYVEVEIDAGSKYEQESEWGLAHYLEHMAFKGTKTRDNIVIKKLMDKYGSFNAHTSFNQIVFSASIHSKYLTETLALLADIIQNSNFKSQEIEKERGVINQEINMYDNDPDSFVSDDLESKVYRGNYTRTILGTEDSISKFTTEDFLRYKEKHYIAENTTIKVIGQYKEDQILPILEENFASIPHGEVSKVEESYYVGGELVSYDLEDREQINLSIDFKGFKQDQFIEINHASGLAYILTGGFTARLTHSIREERGLVYSVSTSHECDINFGGFSFEASTSREHVKLILDLYAKEIRDIIDNGVKPEEFEEWKTKILEGYEMSEWNPDNLAAHLDYFFREGKIYTKDEMLEIVRGFNQETIQRVTQDMFENSLPSISIHGKNPPEIDINDFIAKITGETPIIIPEINEQSNDVNSQVMDQQIAQETNPDDLPNVLIGQEASIVD